MNTSAPSRALNRIRQDGRFPMQELAEIAGVSPRHLYDVASQSESAELKTDEAAPLSRYLSEHGETRLAESFLDPRYRIVERHPGEADGSTEDELRRCVRAAVSADKAHEARDVERMKKALKALDEVRADLEAELDALRS